MKRGPSKRYEQGFSLLELLIASAIFILLCGAAFALLTVAQQRYQTESQVLNAFQEARFGLDQIVLDVNSSGFPPANQFAVAPSANWYASTPVAWSPGYPTNTPCQIGTAGGGTCTTPADFDLIIERDVDPWRHDGVEWTRYQLQGTTLFRGQTYKAAGSNPDSTTAPSFVPYVQNVMNNATPVQIAQFRAIYPAMFPGGQPVPVFNYFCDTPFGTQQCLAAGSYNSPVNILDVEVTLIVIAPTPDIQTGQPRLVELHGRGHRLNPVQ